MLSNSSSFLYTPTLWKMCKSRLSLDKQAIFELVDNVKEGLMEAITSTLEVA
jgi:hypothetical protein